MKTAAVHLVTLSALTASMLVASACSDEPASYDRAADPHQFTVFMLEGGWCWFQDPRAVIQGDHLFIGAVRGNGSGPATVGVYDLGNQRPLGTVVLHDNFDRDDHNSPVFHVRSDGSVLEVFGCGTRGAHRGMGRQMA